MLYATLVYYTNFAQSRLIELPNFEYRWSLRSCMTDLQSSAACCSPESSAWTLS